MWPVCPSVPCCFGAGRCSCYSSVSSSSSNCCFGAGRCFWAAAGAAAAATAAADYYLSSILSDQFPQVFSSSRVAEVTLGTFSVRFCGLFVLPCLAVLVPGGAFGTLLSAAAAAQRQRQRPSSISHQFPRVFSFSRVSEVTLGTFSVRFCGLFVLLCLAVLVPGGAAAETAAAV